MSDSSTTREVMFVAPPSSGKPGRARQLLNRLQGKTRETLETEKFSPEQIRAEFITAINDNNEAEATKLLKRLIEFKNPTTLRRFFRTGQIKEDKALLEKMSNILQSSTVEADLKSKVQTLFKQYVKETQGARLAASLDKTEAETDAVLDGDMEKAIDAMVDFVAASDESEKTTHANRLLRALNIPLHEANSLKKILNSANAPYQLTALINTMKDSKTPSLNLLYNMVFTEGKITSYSDTTYDNLFTIRDKTQDPYAKSRNGTAMIDQLTDSYFKKNGMIGIKGKEKEETTISANPLNRKVFNAIKITETESELAKDLGLNEGFQFSFPSFLRKAAHGKVEQAYDDFMKAYLVLAQRRAQVRKGIDPTGEFGDLSSDKARKAAEAKISDQQAYMFEILQSQAILGDEAYNAIRDHLRNPKIASTIIANLYKHYEISLAEGQDIYALDTINDIEKNIAWIKEFPLEVEVNGQKKPCKSIEDLVKYSSDRDKDVSSQALDLTGQMLDVISGGSNVIDSNDATYGFGGSREILDFAEDCNSEFIELKHQFEKDCSVFDENLDRTRRYIETTSDLSMFVAINDSDIIKFGSDEEGKHRIIQGLDIEDLEQQDELIEQLQIIYNSADAYKDIDGNSTISEVQALFNTESRLTDSDKVLDAISQAQKILKRSTSSDPKIAELREHLHTLMYELKEAKSLKEIKPGELADPRDTLREQMNQTIQSVLNRPEHNAVKTKAKLYFNDTKVELPTEIVTSGIESGHIFNSYRQTFFNDVIKGAYQSSGGTLKTKLHERTHIRAVETLLAHDPSDPSLNPGQALILQVLEADNIAHAKFRPNQEAGLLLQMLNAEKTVAEVSPLGDAQSVRVLDEATSFTALMELRNRALALAGNDQRTVKQIDHFFFNEALDRVISPEASQKLDSTNSARILGKSIPSSELYDSNLGKLYNAIRNLSATTVNTMLQGLTGFQRMAVLTDLRTELEEKISGVLPKIEKQASKNFFGFLGSMYEQEELVALAPVLEAVAEGFSKTRSEIANLPGGYNSREAAKIVEKNFGVKLNDHLPRRDDVDPIADSLFYMMDNRRTHRHDLDSFVQLIIDFINQIFNTNKAGEIDGRSNSQGNGYGQAV